MGNKLNLFLSAVALAIVACIAVVWIHAAGSSPAIMVAVIGVLGLVSLAVLRQSITQAVALPEQRITEKLQQLDSALAQQDLEGFSAADDNISSALVRRIGGLQQSMHALFQDHMRLQHDCEQSNAVMARMTTALDSVSTNVMMADTQYNIIYMNQSLKRMMRKNADQFRTLFGDFDADKLIGRSIDDFHKDPSHQRQLLSTLASTFRTEIKVGNLVFLLTANPVVDDDGKRLGTTLEWTDTTVQKQREALAKENVRVKVALDSVNTNVMISDSEFNIVYMNKSVMDMMRNAERDIRSDIPNFDAAKLMGANIDVFHKNPAHQRGMLEKLQNTYKTRIIVGGRHFDLTANPVIDENNNRLGYVVEWADVTDVVLNQAKVEEDLNNLVDAFLAGDLGTTVSVEGKKGFYLNIANGLNQMSQMVNGFVTDVRDTAVRMVDGDLSTLIVNDYQGLLGEVKDAVNTTTEKMGAMMVQMRNMADAIRTANQEMAQGNEQLSDRTEKQASNLQQTAASLEELTSNVQNTSTNADTANQAAQQAKQLARGGEHIVTDAMSSMREITDSSTKIGEIISVIDDIAFQTNLLALNASVEAARAGEHGRGFAVVATEVRNLAQHSAVSAKEIKELIDDSSVRVKSGSDLVNKCGEALQEISSHVEELTTLISDIANSTTEQASGIAQVNQAVAELDDITQQNAALAEQTASASQSCVQQVDDMVEMLSFFKLNDDTQAHAAPPMRQAQPAKPAPKPKVKASAPARPSVEVDSDDEDWEEF